VSHYLSTLHHKEEITFQRDTGRVGRRYDIENLARVKLSACSSGKYGSGAKNTRPRKLSFTEVNEYEWKDIPVTFAREEPHQRSVNGRDPLSNDDREHKELNEM
jgi:hypothetical protein